MRSGRLGWRGGRLLSGGGAEDDVFLRFLRVQCGFLLFGTAGLLFGSFFGETNSLESTFSAGCAMEWLHSWPDLGSPDRLVSPAAWAQGASALVSDLKIWNLGDSGNRLGPDGTRVPTVSPGGVPRPGHWDSTPAQCRPPEVFAADLLERLRAAVQVGGGKEGGNFRQAIGGVSHICGCL